MLNYFNIIRRLSMINAEVKEEYLQALKQGQKEAKECALQGRSPNPAVLDEILPTLSTEAVLEEE